MNTVLVIGGYGLFGGRLVRLLARQTASPVPLRVLVAGRSIAAAQALVARLQPGATAQLQACALDVQSPTLAADIAATQAGLVVHTAGPFQGQDYRVAQACLVAGAHCIDLADARTFVAGIGALDGAARTARLAVISGASSVPALSSAVVDALTPGWQALHTVDMGISPGNRTERGLSTVQAILSYCGQPLPAQAGEPALVGWRGAYRHRYPAPVGWRWLSPCDLPDLTLLPPRYPGQPRVRFGAGLELSPLHHGMNAMAWLRQAGVVRDWSRHARWLLRGLGTDSGAMHVDVQGLDAAGQPSQRLWHLVARADDGPFVPTLAPGARPCIGELCLADFAQAAQGLQIQLDRVP